jgi:hypothetical protein
VKRLKSYRKSLISIRKKQRKKRLLNKGKVINERRCVKIRTFFFMPKEGV